MTFTQLEFNFEILKLYGFSGFFFVLGIFHFYATSSFEATIPFLHYQKFIVYFTGVLEILFAVLLLFEETRYYTSILVILYLIAIYPANIYMAINPEKFRGFSRIALIIRLPFQFLFIWWVYCLRNLN